MDICHGSRASASIIRVVSNREEANSLLKTARFTDLFVEVLDHGDVHGRGA